MIHFLAGFVPWYLEIINLDHMSYSATLVNDWPLSEPAITQSSS